MSAMQRYRLTKGIITAFMDLNEAAKLHYERQGYTVTHLGPSLVITYGDDGLPTDWRHVGYAAFHRGDPCVPALDRHVTDALDVLDLPTGGAVRNGEHVSAAGIFRAWLAGWTAANLAANPSGLPA